MKALKYTLILGIVALSLSSCVHHHAPAPCYGPDGYDGHAFFGIDYEYSHPYSYWDNNPSVPYNPQIGAYHNTAPGIYDFEYYINPSEFWYGTYEIWINHGGPGRLGCEPGHIGLDSYLMLICDPWGYSEIRGIGKLDEEALKTTPLIIERKNGKEN